MAFLSNTDERLVVEPLKFHHIHGQEIHLSKNNTHATRNRLNNTLLFTNRPILPNEIVEIRIEEISNEFYGSLRIGLTTKDPASFASNPLPAAMTTTDQKDWFVPPPRGGTSLQKNRIIRMKYTAGGEVYVFFFK